MSIGQEPGTTESGTPAKKPRRWLRRLKNILMFLLLAIVLLRLVMIFALPTVLSRVAKFYDLDLQCRRQSLALVGGNMGLWDVKIYPRGGGEQLFAADFVQGEIIPWELLKGKLHVLRAEADGVELDIHRTADGHLPLLDKIAARASNQPTSTNPEVASINFTSPLVLEALRLNKVQAHLRDDAVSPPLDTHFDMELRVSNLGEAEGQPLNYEIDAWAQDVLDLVRIDGTAIGSGPNLDATAHVFMRGLHPKPLAGYLVSLGLKPASESIGMQANANLKVRSIAAAQRTLAVSCALDHIRFSADEKDFATLASMQVDASDVGPGGAAISSIAIDGGRFAAARDADGLLHVAGLALVPATLNAARKSNATTSASKGYAVSLRDLELHDLQYSFTDESLSPPVELKAIVNSISVRPRATDQTRDIKGVISLPGIAKAVRLDGAINPGTDKQSALLALNVEGIKPDLIKPYLAAAGIESELKNAHLAISMRADRTRDTKGDFSTNLSVKDCRFSDESDLLALNQLDVTGVRFDAANERWSVDSIDIAGPNLQATRLPDGSFDALGLHITPVSSSSSSSLSIPIPHVHLGQFSWKDLKLAVTDRTTDPPTELAIDDAGVQIKDLLLDLSAKAGTEKPGEIHAWVHSPQLMPGSLKIDGTLTPGPQSIAADVDVHGEQLQLAPLAPYLASSGIEPVLHDGTLALHAKVGAIGGFDNALTAWVDVTDMTLTQGSDELIGVDGLKIDSMTLKGRECTVGQVDLRNPRGRATRNADGTVEVAGVKVNSAILTAPHEDAGAKPESAATAPTTSPTEAFVATLKQLTLDNAQLHWTDNAVTPAVSTTAYVSAWIDDLTLGRHSSPAMFGVQLASEGIVDDLQLNGEQLDPTPGAELVKMTVSADGIRGAPLAGYFPPGTKPDLADGRLRATVLASRLHGVNSAYVDLVKVDWRDGDSKRLMSFDLGRIAASNLDWAGDTIKVEEISLTNFQSQMTIDHDGNAHLLGVALTSPEPATPASPTTKPAAPTTEKSEPVATTQQLMKPLPNILVDKLDLDIQKFTLTDERHPNAAPVELSDVRIRNTSPIVMGGPDAETQPPAHLEMTGAINPVVGQFTLNIDTAPLASEPVLKIDLSASGIRGSGVTDLLPQLAGQIDGAQMTDGRFTAKAEVRGKFARRGPREFDFTQPFDLDVTLKDVAFRDHDVGRVLAGVDQVTADSIHIEPRTGNVRVKSIEVTTPIGYLERQSDGIHLLGMVIKLPTSAGAATQPVVVAAAPVATPPTLSPTTAPSAAGGDIQIDRFQVNGVDMRIEDKSVDPPLIIPLKSLDLEVRDLSTAALREDRPIRFNAVLEADKVDLPVRSGTAPTTQQTEQRELFSQVTASGSVSLYPVIHGYTKTSLNGYELGSMKGEAAALGVDLDSGILDADIATRFRDEGDMDLHSKFVLTDLKLTEPAHGPIQTRLGLSAPMDVVIPALRDPDGGITIPLNVPLEQGKVSTGNLVGAGVGALSGIMVTAVASVPAKAVSGMTDMFSLSGNKKQDEATVVRLPFKPGDTTLSSDVTQQINEILQRMKKNQNTLVTLRSEMSDEDASAAYERANPPPADCRALAEKLRADRAQMASHRSSLATTATAQLTSADPSASATLQQLAQLDSDISKTDDAIDYLYDMLRPGASNQASRRARAMALQIADLRLTSVQSALMAANLPDEANRVEKVAATDKHAEAGQDGGVVVTIVQRKRQK